ncbi:hypothetical protein [Nisaea nitritireducens]|uniref:hypothetical protein n=1 Tax=Nisaea nitritireducens TaxID=568392 RepID=UPI001866B349|nr:hypothetical protein [Nisaea nitritireducens]
MNSGNRVIAADGGEGADRGKYGEYFSGDGASCNAKLDGEVNRNVTPPIGLEGLFE